MSRPGTGGGSGPSQPGDESSPQCCIPVPGIPPSGSSSLAELSPTRAFLLSSQKNSLLARGCVFGDQAGQGPGQSVAEAGEVTVPGGMAGARPEPPEEGTKPGPARAACPCSGERSPGIEKARGNGERGKQIPVSSPSLPGRATPAAQGERGHSQGGSHPALGMSPLGWHRWHSSGAGRVAGPGHVPPALVAMWKSVV